MKIKTVGASRIYGMVLVMMLSVCVIGCSTDDNGGDDTGGDLVGTWRLVEFTYNGETSTEIEGTSLDSSFDGEGINLDTTITFSEDPNEVMASGSYDIVLTTSFEGESITQTLPIDNFESEGTWSRSGNTLTTDVELTSIAAAGGMTGDMSMTTFSIDELTDTTLRLSASQMEDLSEVGISIMTSVNSVMVLTRE